MTNGNRELVDALDEEIVRLIDAVRAARDVATPAAAIAAFNKHEDVRTLLNELRRRLP